MAEQNSQEAEALDIIESLLDVADMRCIDPLYADNPPRSGMCRISEEDAAQLRQYIANHRAAQENKPLSVTLPCKIGDAVYSVGTGEIAESRVRTFWMGEIGGLPHLLMIRTTRYDIEADQIGKTLFLTREAAEQALNARKPEGSALA